MMEDLPALARRLESIEARFARDFAVALKQARPAADVEAIELAGGWAVYAGPGSPLTEAKGLGMSGPVPDGDLDRLVRFHGARKVASRVSVCPMADPSLIDGLGRRGYHLMEFETILAAPVADLSAIEADPVVEVRTAGLADEETFLHAVLPNFFESTGLTPEARDLNLAMFRISSAHPLLAYLDGRPVGGATLIVLDGVGMLAGAATLPEFRRRGVQRALHAARLSMARELGCDLLTQGAQPGSGSHRNAERIGLRTAYTKVILAREPG